MLEIIPSMFKGSNQEGDFLWMIEQPKYEKALFLFNDNIEHHFSYRKGAGNAVIRTYNKYNLNLKIPKSAGIPTGSIGKGGFKSLTEDVKTKIDQAFDEIYELIKLYKYEKIIYSAQENGKLGTSIFYVSSDVIDYITQKIHELTYFNN
jgi:hypothetical protein